MLHRHCVLDNFVSVLNTKLLYYYCYSVIVGDV